MNLQTSFLLVLTVMAMIAGTMLGTSVHGLHKTDDGTKQDQSITIMYIAMGGILVLLGVFMTMTLAGGFITMAKTALKDTNAIVKRKSMPSFKEATTVGTGGLPAFGDGSVTGVGALGMGVVNGDLSGVGNYYSG